MKKEDFFLDIIREEEKKSKIDKALKKSPDGFQLTIYFVVLGAIMAALAVGMDIAIQNLHEGRHHFEVFWIYILTDCIARFLFSELISSGIAVNWALWTLFILVLVIVGVVFTQFVGPSAIGSGIPQIKTILTGAHLKGLLDKRTFISKVVGLTLLLGSGMIVGKEGPFVHLSCIVAHQLLQLRYLLITLQIVD